MSDTGTVNKREAVFRLLDGGAPSGYTPAAFFLHFGREYHEGPAAVEKHLEFFRSTGMDFVKVQYERPFPRFEQLRTPADWARIPRLDAPFFAQQVAVVEGLVKAAKAEAPVVVTLYSPFMCAGHVAGAEHRQRHIEEDPDAVKRGMEIVTESLMVFVRECIRVGVDGFYHSTQGAEARRFSDPRLFEQCVKPYDLAVMNEIARHCPFNILHICDYHRDEFGGYADLTPFRDYPGHLVNVNPELEGGYISPKEIAALFGRPFMGGLDRLGPLATGTADDARAAARAALRQAPAQFILAADCTVPAGTSWDNLRAAIETAHGGE